MRSFRRCPTSIFILLITGLLHLGGPVAAEPGDVINAVVNVRAEIPNDARTASFLGTDRQGSGIVIDSNGLILTIGYLILEATGVVVTGADGQAIPATIVAYDHESGFGLIKTRRPIDVPPIRLGDSAALNDRDAVLILSRGGPHPISTAQVVSRRAFAGGWEYLLDSAIFTSPPHSFHSGAALIGEDGRLLGIGSLFVGDAARAGVPAPGNMFVPINQLKPILGDLLADGRRVGPYRPWVGANTQDIQGRVLVTQVSPGSPAADAGIQPGDLILGVRGVPVASQIDYYRKLWGTGKAGDPVTLNVLRQGKPALQADEIDLRSMDRYDWLRINSSL